MSDKDLPKDEDALTADGEESGTDDAALEESFFDEEKVAEIKAQLEAESDGLDGLDGAVEGDDELHRIMSPRRVARHPVVAATVICACLFGMYWLWEDMQFFLRSSEPENLGQAKVAVKQGRLKENTYVTLRGRAVPQTMANGTTKTLFGAASKRRVFMFILKDTDNRVVVRTFSPLIINKHKPGPHKFRKEIYTGRLRRLDDTSHGAELRSFYLKRSRQSKALQRDHQLPAAAVLQGAGKPQVTIKDVRGKDVTVKQDTRLALFVTYPGDYEFKVHTGIEDPVDGVVVQAGKGAKDCGKSDPKTGLPAAGRGGSVYVKIDPKSVALDKVADVMAFTAGDAQPGAQPAEGPDDGKDVVLAVPPGTEVYNAASRDCAKVCAHAPKECKASCSNPKGVQITPDKSGRILVAVGGRCGGYAGESHQINLHGKPYETAKRAEAFVASLGFPYVMVEDASKTSRKAVNFVLRLPRAKALKIRKRQTRQSPYNISPRFEVFYVKWRHLERRGPNLVITRTNRGYPPNYVEKPSKAGKRLAAQPLGASLSFAATRIEKAEVSLLLELPKDAFLLEESVRPGSMWTEPFLPGVPIFYLLLLFLLAINLLAIRAHFRG
jgi:GTP1/OBG